MNKGLPSIFKNQILVVMLFSISLLGCAKVKNPEPDPRERHGWLFNYRVYNHNAATHHRTEAPTISFTGKTLQLLAWTNCFPTSVFADFKEAFGAEVELTTFESNDELYDRLTRGRAYDLLMPTGYMVQRLITEDRLVELDHSRLLNLKNLDTEFHTLPYDPGNKYSIPYLWSTSGIAYNFGKINQPPKSWKDLFEPDIAHTSILNGKTSLIPSSRRVFAAAFIYLGYSPNSESPVEFEEAEKFLRSHMEKYRFKIYSADLADRLASEEVLMAMAFSSDIAKAHMKNPNIHFCVPEDGTWVNVENFVIPRTTDPEQQALAEAFINFVLQPTEASRVSNFSFHASTISAAKVHISGSIRNGPAYMRPTNTIVLTSDSTEASLQELAWKRIRESTPPVPSPGPGTSP